MNPSKAFSFLFLLLTLYFILDFHHILFLQPQGIHYIRQTDSLSFAANYYHNGFHFFEPQVYNLNSIDGKAACEFPVLYYLTAILYLLFGEKECILRILTLGISTIGFIYLFKTLHLLFKDVVYAFAFTFIFISSTVLLFYSTNFIPDASALGFTLVGWYFYFRHQQEAKTKYVCYFLILFLIASLLKASYFINPIAAISSLLLLEYITTKNLKQVWLSQRLNLLLFAISLLLVVSWNLYVIYYNQVNHDRYFLTQSRPFWTLNEHARNQVWDHINHYWYSKYYYQTTFHVFLILILASIIFIRKANLQKLIPALLLSIGSICFFFLFFAQFQDHDYYFLTLIPGIMVLVSVSLITLMRKFTKAMNHWIPKCLFVLIALLSMNYGRQKLEQRYEETPKEQVQLTKAWSKTRIELDRLGIPLNAKIIVVGDDTPNASLYFLKRKGWTLKTKAIDLKAKIIQYKKAGAAYCIFSAGENMEISKFMKLVSSKNDVLLYKM